VSRGSFARAAVAIALGALVLRVVYVFLLGAHPALGSDATWYALQAGTIADGVGFVDPNAYYTFHGAVATAQFPPLWPALLALVKLVGFDAVRSYRLVGGFVGAVTVVLTAYVGRRLVSDRVGLVAAVVVAVSPAMIAADGSLMAESLFLVFVTAAVLAAISARRAAGFGWFALVGALLGLATLTRSDGLLVAVVLVPVVAWCTKAGAGRRVALAAVAVAVLVAVLVPWTVRSSDALGDTVLLSSNSGSLISGANCASTYTTGRRLAGWDFSCSHAAEPARGSEAHRAAVQRSKGIDYATDHLGEAVAVGPLRVVRGWGLWSPKALVDAEVPESRTRPMQWAAWGVGLVILGFAVAGAVRMVRERSEVAELFAVVGAASLVLLTSWGNQRFRLVAEPELAVLAAVALVHLWSHRRSVNVRAPSESFSVHRTGVVEPSA
jgi:4-amino-4-deoxy-L-arabinose transferase-like glycosyltransferase